MVDAHAAAGRQSGLDAGDRELVRATRAGSGRWQAGARRAKRCAVLLVRRRRFFYRAFYFDGKLSITRSRRNLETRSSRPLALRRSSVTSYLKAMLFPRRPERKPRRTSSSTASAGGSISSFSRSLHGEGLGHAPANHQRRGGRAGVKSLSIAKGDCCTRYSSTSRGGSGMGAWAQQTSLIERFCTRDGRA